MSRITDRDVLAYIAESAETVIEDDTNEAERWTAEEHAELTRRAFEWIAEYRA